MKSVSIGHFSRWKIVFVLIYTIHDLEISLLTSVSEERQVVKL